MMQKRLAALSLVALVVITVTAAMIFQSYRTESEHIGLMQESLLQEAIAHFDNMVMTRKWNAEHGGVFIRQHDGLQPSPYLKENKIFTDKNETLIKVNPAWMTRQISEISNKENRYYYKITSLKPLNPINTPDAFEREALEYFETHRNEPYYWRLEEPGNAKRWFNFMGALKVTEPCLQCHASQGYKIGDIRGGIRVSVPTEQFEAKMALHREKAEGMVILIIIVAFCAFIGFSILVWNLMNYHERLIQFNSNLETQVNIRTKAVRDLNKHLEERIQTEVLKNREKEKFLLAQSRHAAMGEMIGMLAHQWRQPISVIAMGANNLLVDLELGSEEPEAFKKELRQIVDETKKLSETIDSFRKHFEPEENAQDGITELADEVLQMLGASLRQNEIEVVRDYDEALADYRCPRELLQVYLQLANNAKEALKKSSIEKRRLGFSIRLLGDTVITRIVNTPGSIDEAHIDHLFDPYFSTKTEQNDVGLGLYITKVIIEKHFRGTISLRNEEGGVCAEVRFPRGSGHSAAESKETFGV